MFGGPLSAYHRANPTGRLGQKLGSWRRRRAGSQYPLAVRPIAGRTKQPFLATVSDGTNTQAKYRSRHKVFAFDVAGGVKLVYCNRSGDIAGANAITVRSRIEAPAGSGSWTTVTWSAADSVVIPAGTADAISDALALSLAAGSYINVETYVTVASGGMTWPILDRISLAAANGEGSVLSTSDISASTPPDLNTTYFYGPVAIIGHSRAPMAIAIIGDSIASGNNDTLTGDTIGYLQRTIGTDGMPFLSLAVGSEKAVDWNSTHTARAALLDNCGITHAVNEYGTNDIRGDGANSTTVLSRLSTIYTLLSGKGIRSVSAAILTATNSSDTWATAGNQTIQTGYTVGGTADLVNDALELLPYDTDKFFDGRPGWQDGSNKILTPGYTADGLHPTATGMAAIAATAQPSDLYQFPRTLRDLGMTSTFFSADIADGDTIGTLTNWTKESTLTLADDGGGRVTIDGLDIKASGSQAAGDFDITVRERLPEGGSKDTTISLTVGLAGLVGWFDANDGLTVSSGTTVSGFTNKAGGGDLTKSGTATSIDKIAAGQNGLTVCRVGRDVSSAAAVPHLRSALGAAVANAFAGDDQPYTSIIAYKPTDANTGFIWSAGKYISGANYNLNALVRRSGSASTVRRQELTFAGAIDVASSGSGGDVSGTPIIVAIKHTGTTVSIWNTSLTKIADNVASNAEAMQADEIFRLFSASQSNGDTGSATTQCSLDFYEQKVSNVALPDADIEAEISALATKWGITLS